MSSYFKTTNNSLAYTSILLIFSSVALFWVLNGFLSFIRLFVYSENNLFLTYKSFHSFYLFFPTPPLPLTLLPFFISPSFPSIIFHCWVRRLIKKSFSSVWDQLTVFIGWFLICSVAQYQPSTSTNLHYGNNVVKFWSINFILITLGLLSHVDVQNVICCDYWNCTEFT